MVTWLSLLHRAAATSWGSARLAKSGSAAMATLSSQGREKPSWQRTWQASAAMMELLVPSSWIRGVSPRRPSSSRQSLAWARASNRPGTIFASAKTRASVEVVVRSVGRAAGRDATGKGGAGSLAACQRARSAASVSAKVLAPPELAAISTSAVKGSQTLSSPGAPGWRYSRATPATSARKRSSPPAACSSTQATRDLSVQQSAWRRTATNSRATASGIVINANLLGRVGDGVWEVAAFEMRERPPRAGRNAEQGRGAGR